MVIMISSYGFQSSQTSFKSIGDQMKKSSGAERRTSLENSKQMWSTDDSLHESPSCVSHTNISEPEPMEIENDSHSINSFTHLMALETSKPSVWGPKLQLSPPATSPELFSALLNQLIEIGIAVRLKDHTVFLGVGLFCQVTSKRSLVPSSLLAYGLAGLTIAAKFEESVQTAANLAIGIKVFKVRKTKLVEAEAKILAEADFQILRSSSASLLAVVDLSIHLEQKPKALSLLLLFLSLYDWTSRRFSAQTLVHSAVTYSLNMLGNSESLQRIHGCEELGHSSPESLHACWTIFNNQLGLIGQPDYSSLRKKFRLE